MRITGLATGLDMDEIIKNSMKPYRIKVDQMTQKKDVTEIKQKLYRDIMSDATKFYDKYFDVAKSDSLLKVGSYKSVSFTSSSDAVTVTGSSTAKAGNYTITGSVATAAKKEFDAVNVKSGDKWVIEGKEFILRGEKSEEIVKNLNEDLKKIGKNVTARYTEFGAEGSSANEPRIILESDHSSGFKFGGAGTVGKATVGVDETATVVKITKSEIGEGKQTIKIGDKEIEVDLSASNLEEEFNNKLKAQGINITAKVEGENITLTSSEKGSTSKFEVKSSDDRVLGKTTVGVDETATAVKITKSEIGEGKQTIKIGDKEIEVDLSASNLEEEFNNKLKAQGINITAKVEGENITLTSSEKGSTSKFEVLRGSGEPESIQPKPANITITDIKGGVYKHTGTSNTVTLDGITFTFNGKIDGEVKITGKNDVTETKDKLVSFINDYNTFMEKLNTLTGTKHDKAYDPLTEDQKKEMSESEIKLWNERVEKGQLYKDSNLTRIANSLKSTMRTVMDGTGLNLEKIGIKPVQDYSGKLNGTFTIDEDKLTTALEEDIEGVMNLFIGQPEKGETTTESQYTSKTGILYQLNETLRKEFKTSSSLLSQKAGMEGMSTFGNNELTKSMSDYEKKIKDMEKDFSRREQALYSKYATLEKMMNNLNSQQSNLMSQLGMS